MWELLFVCCFVFFRSIFDINKSCKDVKTFTVIVNDVKKRIILKMNVIHPEKNGQAMQEVGKLARESLSTLLQGSFYVAS